MDDELLGRGSSLGLLLIIGVIVLYAIQKRTKPASCGQPQVTISPPIIMPTQSINVSTTKDAHMLAEPITSTDDTPQWELGGSALPTITGTPRVLTNREFKALGVLPARFPREYMETRNQDRIPSLAPV